MFTGTLLTALKDKGFNDVKLIEAEEPKGCEGLHHGNYYTDIIDAVENFKERT